MKNVMRILVAVIMVISATSFASHEGLTVAKNHQVQAVKTNKKQSKGLKKAS